MPKGVEDLTIGKLESLLHIVDLVRGLDSRMEMQTLAIFLYVARHGRNNRGITMEEIANEVGIAQSSCSRGVMKLSDGILNPPGEVLDRAAKRRRPPSREALKPKYGIGLLLTQDDPYERRRKIVYLSPMGERIASKLMDYTVASRPMSASERKNRLKEIKEGKDIHKQTRLMEYEQKYMTENMRRLEQLHEDFSKQLDSISKELKEREKQSSVPFTELLKEKNFPTSSGYMREGANVRSIKKKK